MSTENHAPNTNTSVAESKGLVIDEKEKNKLQNQTEDSPASKQVTSRSNPTRGDESEEEDTFHDAEDVTNTTNTHVLANDTSDEPEGQLSDQKKSLQSEVPRENGAIELSTSGEEGHSQEKANTEDLEAPLQKEQTIKVDTTQTVTKDESTSSTAKSALTDSPIRKRSTKTPKSAVSEWSHQKLAPETIDSDNEEEEEQWQAMPALGDFDIYDDRGRIVAKGSKAAELEFDYAGLGGAGKGYTRVQLDEDAQSATSMDEDTSYLFQQNQAHKPIVEDEHVDDDDDDEQRDALTQLQTTKELLTEGQRIAYVGVVRLTVFKMLKALGDVEKTRGTKKELGSALESMEKWGQQMMVRLYSHMDIDSAEQLMIEQLAEHDVQPADLVPPLMQNAKVKNPLRKDDVSEKLKPDLETTNTSSVSVNSSQNDVVSLKDIKEGDEVPEVHGPEDMPTSKQIDVDIRWTVLCDLFLVLITDGVYDSRSRRLLERVASAMQISWVQICRFEKRVIDSLEGQEEELKENWDESENMEKRRKSGLKRKYVVMGLATVGGGLVIGLSAGLLAPMIGAGLAAGFTTIGVGGTAGFLGGVGGAALITSAATVTGGTIAVRASNRRTGHVQTFEYRPLHNNKRLNLILTVSGWMTGKVDDVRLPYSTVDPIMGDIYSLLWEPEMLQSMGDTINILATEALTQTVQQVLGSTILVALMASIQLPVVLTKLAYLIDNPWNVSLDRAWSAGLILADSLIDRHLGQRPVTLLGFSLGSRLIFSCLKELSRRGAYGIVQNVYLFGSPVVARKDEYLRARSVISGRFVNGYASNDWILGYLFRATAGGIMKVAGLAPVENIPGLENLDVGHLVKGHMGYRAAMPRLLREVGWEVESDEFTEIEDPDPENHAARQRELILEIDEARKKAEGKPEKKRFGLFKKGKLAEKKGWETYDADKAGKKIISNDAGEKPGLEANVLFDIDAIRKELESEMIEVRELNSTLPPMQITTIQNGEKHVEYLRLPRGLTPEEVTKMKLPPRPDEVEPNIARTSSPDPGRKLSFPFLRKASPKPTPATSPNPPIAEEYTYEQPRELKSTLPPLNLTSTVSSRDSNLTPPPYTLSNTRSISPAPPYKTTSHGNSASNLASPPVEGVNLEHNAWADDDFSGQPGEIKMTFE